MRKHRQREGDDIARDGESVRVPMMLTDAARARGMAQTSVRIVDAWGRPGGMCRGYVFPNHGRTSFLADAEAAREAAWADGVRRMNEAWKMPGPRPISQTLDARLATWPGVRREMREPLPEETEAAQRARDQSRDAAIREMRNAWKGPSRGPDEDDENGDDDRAQRSPEQAEIAREEARADAIRKLSNAWKDPTRAANEVEAERRRTHHEEWNGWNNGR
jgi:hypothetical protein